LREQRRPRARLSHFADCAGSKLKIRLQLQGEIDPTGHRGLNVLVFAMPLFSFRTCNAERSSASDACELEGRDAAWKELTRVCSDLIAGSCHSLKENSEWSMEVLDAANAPLFRIRLVAETLD
jgi:hypothetical protein